MKCKITGKLINPSALVVVSHSASPDIPPGNYHVDSLVTSARMAEEISDLTREIERLEDQLQEGKDIIGRLATRLEELTQ